MRFALKTGALAALACLAMSTRSDAEPLPAGTWYGVPTSISPAGSTQTFSVQTTPAGYHAVNVTVVYACPGGPRCTFSATAGEIGPGVYVVLGPLPPPAPLRLFALLRSSACNATYGASAIEGVLTTGASGGPEIAECMTPGVGPLGSGGAPPHPVTPPHLIVPRIPPYVQRPGPIGPGPAPGPNPPH